MRLFTGISLPRHVSENLARVLKELRPLADLNWSPMENLHITSKFIGEWPERRLPELEEALKNLHPPGGFEIAIARFGYFPNPHNPRTLFAGVEAGPELADLAIRIDETLRPLGIAHDPRPYSPHLTLARIKNENIRSLRQHIANMTNFDFGTFRVSEFHLYLSNRLPAPLSDGHGSVTPILNRDRQGAAVYTPLATYPLPSVASLKA
jgi:2'-5' RNA ligase